MTRAIERGIRGNKLFESFLIACAYGFECGMKFRIHNASLLNDHEHRYNRRYGTQRPVGYVGTPAAQGE